MRRILLRAPLLRWCALQHLKRVRQNRREAAQLETEALLIALGNITIMWAGINLILNVFIEAHLARYGPIIRKDLPRSFTGKLDYLRKVETRHLDWRSEVLAELRTLRLELADLNEQRINVVHGILWRQGYGPKWTIHIAEEVGDRLHRDKLPRDSQDIQTLSLWTHEMLSRTSAFFRQMFGK